MNDVEKHASELRPARNSHAQEMTRLYLVLLGELAVCAATYLHYEALNAGAWGQAVPRGLLAPVLLGLVLAALAQLISQTFMARPTKLVPLRLAKFAVWGAINAAITTLYLAALQQLSLAENDLMCVVVDQLLMSPISQMLFVVWHSVWDDLPLGPLMRTHYPRSMMYSYSFWPFVSVFCFFILPDAMVFPVNCFANVVWNVILSMLA